MPAEEFASRGGNEIGPTVFDEEAIRHRVGELGHEICEYYQSGELLLIGLLKGASSSLAIWYGRSRDPIR